jgi:hypothetical protein
VRRQDINDRLKVARALMVGRRAAMAESGANHPEGKPYFTAFSRWLADHPKLAAVSADDRAAALWCLEAENWPRVRSALAALDDKTRQRASLRALRARLVREAEQQAVAAANAKRKPVEAEPARAVAGDYDDVDFMADEPTVAVEHHELEWLLSKIETLARWTAHIPVTQDWPDPVDGAASKRANGWDLNNLVGLMGDTVASWLSAERD